jgi:hypothetical protein
MAVPPGRALLIEDALDILIEDALDIALARDIANAEAARMAWHLEALLRFSPDEQFVRWVSGAQSYISSLKTTVCIPALEHFPELQDPQSMPYRTLSQAMRVPGFRLPGFKQAPHYLSPL